jgi:hypothetical protein
MKIKRRKKKKKRKKKNKRKVTHLDKRERATEFS